MTVHAGRRLRLAYIRVYARAEWRVRWRSHLVLAGVTAATVAAAVATMTAAGRSDNAFHRLRAMTHASDAIVLHPDAERRPARAVAAVKAVDGVESAAAEAELFVRPVGTDYFPDYNLYAIAPLVRDEGDGLNTPVVVKGRPVDPGRDDEVALSEDLAAATGVDVGDSITLESMTAKWTDLANKGGDPGPPDGPRLKVSVVGVVRTPADFGRFKGLLYLSPSFVEHHGRQLNVYAGVHVQLSGRALSRARDGTLTGLPGVDVSPSPFADDAATDDGLGTIAGALRLVAAAAILAGAIATALALDRLTRVALVDRHTLAAMGWSQRGLVAVVILVFAPWLFVGVGLGLLLGVFTSPLVMVGLARSVDPTPGAIVLDHRVVFLTTVAAAVFGLVMVAVTAVRVTAPRERRAPRAARGLQLRRPLPAVLGLRHALFSDGEAGGGASRRALGALAAAVAAAVAALAVSASIALLQTDPSLTGQGTARVIDSGESVEVYDRALPLLEKDARVAMLVGVHISFDISAAGVDDLTTLIYDVRRGDLGASVVRGRIARQEDEVALGPATLHRLRKGVGDSIKLRGDRGTTEFRIVGAVLFPEGDFAYDAGAALTSGGADRLLGNVHDAAQIHQVAFGWADRVDAQAADRTLSAAGLKVLTNKDALKPAAVSNLGQVEALPRYLAVFFGLLGLATLGHALATTARLRSRELGTLHALGLTRRAGTAMVASHALTLLLIAVAGGLPLGLVAGKQIWAPIANRAHVVVRAVSPWPWIALLLVIAFGATGVVTALPAWRAFRLRPADALRAE